MAWFSRKQKLLTMRMKGEMCAWSSHEQPNGKLKRNEKIIMHIGQVGLQIKFNVSFWSPNFSTRVRWPLQNDPHRCFVVIVRRSPPRSGGWGGWSGWGGSGGLMLNTQFDSMNSFYYQAPLENDLWGAISLKEAKRLPHPPEKDGKWFPKLLLSYKYVQPKLSFSNKL